MKKLYLQYRSNSGKSTKLYLFFIIILILLVFYYVTYLRPKSQVHNNNTFHSYDELRRHGNDRNSPFQGAKIVHLDLKGAPPKISYFKFLFPLLAKMGATGILIEYEDMFPYNTPSLKNISALNAYSLDDIRLINHLAVRNKLDIIPLFQTFGHLEFLLKLEEHRDLREVPEYPQVICPTHHRTLALLLEMIEQVIDLHPHSRYVHIGADEVFYLGYCERCSAAMSKFSLTKNMLFLEHINAIATRIHHKHPRLKILMWDDEFRSFTAKELKNGYLHKSIEPVVWKYSKDVDEELGPSLWDMYAQVFPRLWAASAFKGATGSNQYVNDVTHYVQNHRSWLSLMAEHRSRVNFVGIIITGWQRYDHFAILCELLPVSLPSLAMSLRVLQGYNDSPLSPPTEVAKLLACEQPYALIGPAFGSPRCAFAGGGVLEVVLRLQQLVQEYEVITEDSRVKGWMNDFNKNHAFSNPQHVQSVTARLGRIKEELDQVKSDVRAAMDEVYDEFTISEWKETYLEPFDRQVVDLLEARDKILAKEAWPRRPLSNEL